MVLTSVQKRKNKVTLRFNTSEEIEISYEIYLNSGLYKDDKVDRKKVNQLILQNDLFLVKNSAFRYLSNRNHSSSEIKVKLRKKGFDIEIINSVIKELKEKEYIDDFKFAESFVKFRIERRNEGLVKIHSELIKRGITSEIISDVISKFKDDIVLFNNAQSLGEKKYQSLKDKSLEFQKLKGRLFNFLKSKGYTIDIIIKVVDDILKKDNYNEPDNYS